MKTLPIVAALLLATSVAHARPQASLSLGPVLSVPELFGGQLSYWLDDDVSLEARVTLSTAEAGLTGHVGLSRNANGASHDLLATAMGGFVHREVRAGTYSDSAYGNGGRVIGALGYGLTKGIIDLRLLGGLSAYEATGWHFDPTFSAYLGFFL